MKFVTQNRESKNKKNFSTIIKAVDTFINFATNSSSIGLSISGFGLIVIKNSTRIPGGSALINEVIYGRLMKKRH